MKEEIKKKVEGEAGPSIFDDAAVDTGAVRIPQNEHRCRDIVLRAQLGDIPTNADLSFLRNGCH